MFSCLLLCCLFAGQAYGQREERLPAADGSTMYAADGDYMARVVQNASKVDLEFFKLNFGQWEKMQTINLRAADDSRRVEEIAMDGSLVAVTSLSLDGTGKLLPYRLENGRWNKKFGINLTQQNMQRDQWGSELELYDSGNPTSSYIAVGVPGFPSEGLIVLFGFSSSWGLNSGGLASLTGRFANSNFGYQIALSKDYLAVVHYYDADPVIQIPNLSVLDVYKISDLIDGRNTLKRLTYASTDFQSRNRFGDKVVITNNEYIAYTYNREDRRNQIRIGRIADFYNATSTQDQENVFDELDMPNVIDDEFGETLAFLTNKTPDGTNYYLAVGAPFTEVNGSIVAGRVYLYNYEGITSPGRWGTTRFSKSFDGEKLEDQLGYALYFTNSGLIAPTFILNTTKYFNFLPSIPTISSLTSSKDEIRLSVEKNEADENLTGQVFGPTFTLTDNQGKVNSTENSGSFTVTDNELGLGIGNYAAFNVVAENAFGQSPPLATGAFFKGDGRIQGTVNNPQGGNVDGVRINTKYDGDYYLLFGLSAGIDDFVKAPIRNFPSQDFTVEFWANPTTVGGRYLISYSTPTDGDNTFSFGWSDSNSLDIWVNNTSYRVDVDKNLSQTWSHYAITRSVTSMQVYIDGEPAASRSVTGSQVSAEGTLVIGQESDSRLGGNFSAQQNFKGRVDELRIWNRVRTDEEIRQNYNSVIETNSMNVNEDLVLNYRFDENLNTNFRTVYDEKANAGSADSNPGLLTQGTGSSGINYVKSSGLNKTAVTENGSFSFTNLTYGEYTLIPDDEGGRREFDQDQQTVSVTADGSSPNNIEFTDLTSFTVTGQVTFEYEGKTYPAANVPVAFGDSATIEGSADTVYTDADGNYEIELKAGEFTVFPEFADHTFAPAQAQISLPADKDAPLNFVNTTTRTISGTFVGGSCELNVGSATLNLRNATSGIEINGIKTDFDGNVHRYEVGGIPAFIEDSVGVTIVSLGNEGKQPEDADYLVLEKLIQGEGGFLDAEQFARLDSTNATVDFFYRAPTELRVESSSLTPIECYENTFLMSEGDFITLSISAFETYNGQECRVDSAEVRIFDDISDRTDSLTYIRSSNFTNFAYSLQAGNPNVVGGGPRPYQKALQIDVTPPGALTVSKTIWAVVEGSTPRIGQPFVSIQPSLVPLFILHDPPGDRSYSWIEEGKSFSRSIALSDASNRSNGGNLRVGSTDISPFVTTSFDIGFTNNNEESFNVAFSSNTRISTSDEDGVMPGKPSDVFVGTNLNLIYGITDILSFNPTLCEVELTQDIEWTPGEIESTFLWTYNEIKNLVIPDLEETLALSSDPQKIKLLTSSIRDWNKLLLYDDYLHDNTVSVEKETLSFGGELGSRELTKTITKTKTNSYSFSTTYDVNVEVGVGFGLAIPTVGVISAGAASYETNIGYEYTDENTTTEEKTFEIGYLLDDDDTGDSFLVEVSELVEENAELDTAVAIGSDVRERNIDFNFEPNTPLSNITPFFRLTGGQSSAPWEGLPSVPRDSAQINVSPRRQTDIPPGESAVFTINVGNLSQSGDARDVEVRVLPGTNPDGLLISTGSGNITGNTGILLEDVPANDSRTITFTARKGPLAFDYRDIAIVALSPYELEATAGSQRLSDTTFFSVSFDTPCEPVNVFLPEENWVINSGSNNSMRVVIDEYNKENIDQVVLQYRRLPVGQWQTVDAIQGSELNDSFTSTAVDVSSLEDGEYQFRAATDCGSGLVYSEYYTGTIDRQPPVTLNEPQPSDGVLSPEDVITLVFNENIDPLSIVPGNFILTNSTTGDTLDVNVVNNERRIVMNFDNEDPANENQSFQATVRSVSDRYGNIIEPIRWGFIVNRNPVSWLLPRIIEHMSEGEDFAFDAQVVNNGQQALDFTLENLPAWMEVISERKSIEAGETRFVSFRITDPAALIAGQTYKQPLELVTDLGREPLEVTLKVSCAKPAWTVETANFANSMEVSISPNTGNLSLAQPNDVVAAFVGDEVRGVAEVYKLVPDDRYVAYLQVYSNQETGEEVTFKLFDASECEIIDLPLTVTFEDQSTVGEPDAPEIPRVPDANMGYQEIALSAGINWISFNVAQADMSVNNVVRNLGLRDGSFISTHDGEFAQFVNFVGWQGTLDSLQTGKLYKLNVPADTVLRLNGNKAVNEISIQEGWNGIGFVKKEATAIAQAFQSYGLSEGDRVLSQDGSATYTNGNWDGSLANLNPGEGYLFQSGTAGTLSYARVNNSTGWTVNPGEYNQYMNIVGILEIDGVEYGKNDAVIGAFVGEECRGYVQPIQSQGQWLYFMTVYGNSPEDTLTFRMQRNGQEEVQLEQKLAFINESLQGEVREPYIFRQINEEILRAQNFAPLSIQLSDTTLLSDASNTAIGIFLTQDPNPGDQHTYQLVEGEGADNNSLFTIVNDELVNTQPIAYEPGQSNAYSIRVSATDNGGEVIERILTIKVINANNSEPTAISLSNNSLLFDQEAGTFIGDLSVEDPDAEDVHNFTILSVNNDATSDLFRIENGQLVSNAVFTEDMMGTYELVVLVEDGNGGSLQQILSVEVTDTITNVTDAVSGELALSAFKPNPTSGNGSFTYYLPSPSKVTIKLSDMVGRVWEKIEKNQMPGSYQISLDLSDMPQGVYLYSIETEGEKSQILTRRVIKY